MSKLLKLSEHVVGFGYDEYWITRCYYCHHCRLLLFWTTVTTLFCRHANTTLFFAYENAFQFIVPREQPFFIFKWMSQRYYLRQPFITLVASTTLLSAALAQARCFLSCFMPTSSNAITNAIILRRCFNVVINERILNVHVFLQSVDSSFLLLHYSIFYSNYIICTNWPLLLRLLLDVFQNKTIMPCQSKEISRRSSFKGEAIMIKMKKL